MYCDQIQCKHCGSFFVFRLSEPGSGRSSQGVSEDRFQGSVVACPECKHVYDYASQAPQRVPTPWGDPGSQAKGPVVFLVPLECEAEDCDTPLEVVAPRAAGTTDQALQAELSSWVLHDLVCAGGHPVRRVTGTEK